MKQNRKWEIVKEMLRWYEGCLILLLLFYFSLPVVSVLRLFNICGLEETQTNCFGLFQVEKNVVKELTGTIIRLCYAATHSKRVCHHSAESHMLVAKMAD